MLLPTSALLLFCSLKPHGPQIHQMVCVKGSGLWQCISLCVCFIFLMYFNIWASICYPVSSFCAYQLWLQNMYCCWHLVVMTENNLAKEWEALCSLNSGFNFLICSYDRATTLVAFVMRMEELITCFFLVKFRSFQMRLSFCIRVAGSENPGRIFCAWS